MARGSVPDSTRRCCHVFSSNDVGWWGREKKNLLSSLWRGVRRGTAAVMAGWLSFLWGAFGWATG